jgi:hypothetical protein
MTLLAGGATSLVSGIVYAVVGARIASKPGGSDDRTALRAFGAWWLGLSLLTLVGAFETFLWLAGARAPVFHVPILYLTLIPLFVALWGIFYYLAYLFSGRRSLLWISAALYAGLYAAFVVIVVMLDPVGVKATTWDVRVEYGATLSPAATFVAMLLLLAPILLAAVAYGSLIFRLRDPAQRFRVIVVCVALLVWFGGPLGAQLAGFGDSDAWAMANRFLSLACALAILFAYRPSARVLRRVMRGSGQGGDRGG